MASRGKKKISEVKVVKISYKDLVRHPKDGEPQQVQPEDPEWDDGIACIKAYQSQATMLTHAQQEEMRDLINGLHYVVPQSAVGTPASHKLYKTAIKKIKDKDGSPSWPVFIILTTLYEKLPVKYIEKVRQTYGRTLLDDYTDEYLAIEGTEPAAPAPRPSRMTRNRHIFSTDNTRAEEMSNSRKDTMNKSVVITLTSSSPEQSESEEFAPVSNPQRQNLEAPTIATRAPQDDSMPLWGNSIEQRNQDPKNWRLDKKRQSLPTAIEGASSPAKKRSKMPNHDAFASSASSAFEKSTDCNCTHRAEFEKLRAEVQKQHERISAMESFLARRDA